MAATQLKLVFPIVIAALLFAPSILGTQVEYCDRRTKYAVKVSDVDISPNPIVRGEKATFRISASSGKPISGGKMVIEVKYFGFNVHSEDHDLCDETSCPITGGDFVISHSQVLPGITPPGSYTLKMKMLAGNGKELTCVHFDFSVGWFAGLLHTQNEDASRKWQRVDMRSFRL